MYGDLRRGVCHLCISIQSTLLVIFLPITSRGVEINNLLPTPPIPKIETTPKLLLLMLVFDSIMFIIASLSYFLPTMTDSEIH